MNAVHLPMDMGVPDLSEMHPDGQGTSLDAMLKQAFESLDTKAASDKQQIDSHFANAASLSSPENLIALQEQLQNYNIFISLASTVTRKAVSTVETLVKAQ